MVERLTSCGLPGTTECLEKLTKMVMREMLMMAVVDLMV
jgi:hypothetical protein